MTNERPGLPHRVRFCSVLRRLDEVAADDVGRRAVLEEEEGVGEAFGPDLDRIGPGSGPHVEIAGPGERDPPCAEEGAVEEARAVVRDDEPTVPVCAGRTLRVD